MCVIHSKVGKGNETDQVLLCYSLEEGLTKDRKEEATPGSSFKPWNGEKVAERSSTRGQESGKGHSFCFLKIL